MDHGGIAGIGLVVARGDTPKAFEAAEEVFDQMTPLVHLEVARNVLGTISLWRNDGKSTTLIQVSAERITIERFVGEQGCEGDVLEQGIDTGAVVPLAGQQHELQQVAKGIDQGDDLRRQATARPSDGLILGPPLAPVPCWCTRTMVPSTITYSKSASSDNTVKICSKTPRLAHLRNRWKTEFHLPKDSGRSRQGAPTRATHSTASRNSRLSAADCPGSPTFPGRRGASRSHCSSRKTLRSKATSLFRSLEANIGCLGKPLIVPECQQALARTIELLGRAHRDFLDMVTPRLDQSQRTLFDGGTTLVGLIRTQVAAMLAGG